MNFFQNLQEKRVLKVSDTVLGPEEPFVNLQSTCFEKVIFKRVLNVRKSKRIAKFERLEPRRCEDIKGIVAPKWARKVSGL